MPTSKSVLLEHVGQALSTMQSTTVTGRRDPNGVVAEAIKRLLVSLVNFLNEQTVGTQQLQFQVYAAVADVTLMLGGWCYNPDKELRPEDAIEELKSVRKKIQEFFAT